ncbi:MAG: hypothetical protein WBA45_13040 [Microthrixaceae bacterium]
METMTMERITFEVTLADGTVEQVDEANSYQQEQSMTTFFRSDNARQAVDCWSVRIASFRTDAIISIRRNKPVTADVRHLRPA